MGLCAGQDAAFQAGILANITIKQKNRTKYYKTVTKVLDAGKKAC